MQRSVDELGHTPKSLRVRRGLSIQKLADLSHVSVNTIARIEAGLMGYEVKTRAVASALGVSFEVLSEAMRRVREEAA